MSKDQNNTTLERRQFLQGVGATALTVSLGTNTSLASTGSTSSRGNTSYDYDVLIIGGGFAGVTAARDLKKNGYSCAILEVRNRLGGRTYTVPYGDTQVELGGTWIHWMQPFIWAEVMRYGLEIKETPGATADRIIQLRDGKVFELDLGKLYSDLFIGGQGFIDKARSIWPRPFDTGFNMEGILNADSHSILDLLDELDLTNSQRSIYERLLGGGTNAQLKDVSANEALRIFALCGHNIGSYYDVNARYQLKDGTIALINKMVEDGKPEVRLNTHVRHVEQKVDHVIVSTATGEVITAAAVVCTLPLNVLKDVEFLPEIHPHKLAASKEGHPGRGFKVIAEVKGTVPNILLYGDKDEAIEEALVYHIGDDRSLIACFGNDSNRDDIYNTEYLQKTLRKYLPEVEVTGTMGYPWTNDPFAQGTWCTWRPGWYQKYQEGLRDGPEGRVFFASSDFCEGSRGYIDGAVGSGIKAAQQIREILS